MKVLIVSKTKLWDHICVGGLVREPVQNIRLLSGTGEHATLTDGYEIGQVWEMDFTPSRTIERPHTENVLVASKDLVSLLDKKQTREAILRYVSPTKGNIDQLFSKKIVYPEGAMQSAYISEKNVPSYSTTFWLLDVPLTLVQHRGKNYYRYQKGDADIKMPYVGFDAMLTTIPAGSLLRMSLARWFDQEGTTEPRCYLQLSGWWFP